MKTEELIAEKEKPVTWADKFKIIARIEGFETDKEMATVLGCSITTVYDLRAGKIKDLKSPFLFKLNELGYSLNWLVKNEGDPKDNSSSPQRTSYFNFDAILEHPYVISLKKNNEDLQKDKQELLNQNGKLISLLGERSVSKAA